MSHDHNSFRTRSVVHPRSDVMSTLYMYKNGQDFRYSAVESVVGYGGSLCFPPIAVPSLVENVVGCYGGSLHLPPIAVPSLVVPAPAVLQPSTSPIAVPLHRLT